MTVPSAPVRGHARPGRLGALGVLCAAALITSGCSVLINGLPGTSPEPTATASPTPRPTPTPVAWTAPTVVYPGGYRGVSMSVDSTGAIDIATQVEVGSMGATELVFLTDRGGTWTRSVVAELPRKGYEEGYWDVVSLALDDQDRVYIAATRTSGGTGCACTDGVFLYTDKGRPRGDFGPGVKVGPRDANDPAIKVHDGHVFVAYRTGFYEPGDEQADGVVWLATDVSGSWSRARVADHLPAPEGAPALRIREDGRAVVAFGADGIRLATATSPAGTAFRVQRIQGTDYRDSTVSLVLASDGSPRLAFLHYSENDTKRGTIYARPAGAGWVLDRFTGRYGLAAISIDTHDRPGIVVADEDDGEGIFLYSGTLQKERLVTTRVPDSLSFRVTGAGPMVLSFTTDRSRANLFLTTTRQDQ